VTGCLTTAHQIVKSKGGGPSGSSP